MAGAGAHVQPGAPADRGIEGGLAFGGLGCRVIDIGQFGAQHGIVAIAEGGPAILPGHQDGNLFHKNDIAIDAVCGRGHMLGFHLGGGRLAGVELQIGCDQAAFRRAAIDWDGNHLPGIRVLPLIQRLAGFQAGVIGLLELNTLEPRRGLSVAGEDGGDDAEERGDHVIDHATIAAGDAADHQPAIQGAAHLDEPAQRGEAGLRTRQTGRGAGGGGQSQDAPAAQDHDAARSLRTKIDTLRGTGLRLMTDAFRGMGAGCVLPDVGGLQAAYPTTLHHQADRLIGAIPKRITPSARYLVYFAGEHVPPAPT